MLSVIIKNLSDSWGYLPLLREYGERYSSHRTWHHTMSGFLSCLGQLLIVLLNYVCQFRWLDGVDLLQQYLRQYLNLF